MARPDFPRTIVEFQERFPDEAACLEYLAASRWPEGYRCPACGGERAWVLERRHLWECAAVITRPRSPRGRSCTAPARRFASGSGRPTWSPPTHPGSPPSSCSASSASRAMRPPGSSCRSCAGRWSPPSATPLRGEVEVDEGFLGGVNPDRKAGRDPVGKRLVGVAVEVRGAGSGTAAPRGAPGREQTQPRALGRRERRARRDRPHRRLGRLRRTSPTSALTTGRSPSAGAARSAASSSRAPTAPSPTSRPGCRAPTAAPPRSTCRSTSTSSSSATTAAAPRWPPFRRCSDSARRTSRAPMPRSPAASLPERTGYS